MSALGQTRRWQFPASILRLLLALALLAVTPAFGQSQDQSLPALSGPALSGRVVDAAGMIDAATRQTLTGTLERFEAKSSDQIVVATVPDLGGEAIEPYANRLFRQWKLGQAGENNGVLVLVSRDDRKMRIEVGYGLEGTLTDLHSRLVIENSMVPAFRKGDYAGGITKAVDDIIMVLEGNGAELEARARRNQSATDTDWIETIVIFIFLSLFIGAFGFAVLTPIFGRRLGPGRYEWHGVQITYGEGGGSGGSSSGGGWSSSGGGFSGGGGSSGGGGASGSW